MELHSELLFVWGTAASLGLPVLEGRRTRPYRRRVRIIYGVSHRFRYAPPARYRQVVPPYAEWAIWRASPAQQQNR